MKMSIVSIEYHNIRKISDLSISFMNAFGFIKHTFIMMGNGTGKTTTLTLIRGLLDESAVNWPPDIVRSFKPINKRVETGSFSMSIKFDDSLYKYILTLNYNTGIANIETVARTTRGRENGLHLPESLHGIFTPDFVKRFVFDGEQAEKTLDSSSNEAEEAIKYLYRLDKLKEVLTKNESILLEIQNAESAIGTSASISNLRTRRKTAEEKKDKLIKRSKKLKKDIKNDQETLQQLEEKQRNLYSNYESLSNEKNNIIGELKDNRKYLDLKISEIIGMVKSPCLLSQAMCNRMFELGASMKKLKLPKTISKDFFTELAHASECVCGRSIGENEKAAILSNADKYLGSDQQSVLNEIKSSLINCTFEPCLSQSFKDLEGLRKDANRLNTRLKTNEEALLEAGGDKAATLQKDIDKLRVEIGIFENELQRLESKDDSNPDLNEDNNIYKATQLYNDYDAKIASATRTADALRKKNIIDELVNTISVRVTDALKQEIIAKTNEKLRQVIADDLIEIEEINRCIKLKSKSGASAGQTLSIAYCFLGTMFEDAELDFPFIIDSPAGSMDLVKRKAIADIVPHIFNQMIAFVTSAEVEQFADQFYNNTDSQYITIIANAGSNNVEVHTGQDFFDSYQREHMEA